MCSEEEESTLGFSDCEEAMEDECYPPPSSLFICDAMEVIGCVDEDDEVRVDLFIWVICPFFLFTKNMFIKLMLVYTGKLENGYWIFESKVNEYYRTI